MQLFLILLMLLYGGREGDALGELRPLIESLAGEDVKSALKNAQKIRDALSAFGGDSFKGAQGHGDKNGGTYAANNEGDERGDAGSEGGFSDSGEGGTPDGGRAFAPDAVAGIADKEILYRLVRYFAAQPG